MGLCRNRAHAQPAVLKKNCAAASIHHIRIDRAPAGPLIPDDRKIQREHHPVVTGRHKQDLEDLVLNWDQFGKDDPLWAILSEQGKSRNNWDQAEFFATGISEIDEVIAYVTGRVENASFGKALDFGCGVGRCTQALAKHYSSVIGVDISPSMIDLANKFASGSDRCSYVLNTVDDLSIFDDEEFDFVYSSRVLPHMPPSLAGLYIGEFFRVTKPGGLVLFQLPSAVIEPRVGNRVVGRIKSIVKTMAGSAGLRLYRRMRFGTSAEMAMNVTAESQVRRIVESHSGRVEDVVSDGASGPTIESLRYCALKV